MQEPFASKMLKITLYVIFGLGILITVTLPFMLDHYVRYLYHASYVEQGYHNFILVFLIIVATLGLWAIWEMIRMLHSVGRDPFVIRNVRALNRVGIILFILAVLFFGKCCVYVTVLTLGCGFLFTLGGLFAFTLARLFHRAVTFKEENDLTI
jgi:hypothetical protein